MKKIIGKCPVCSEKLKIKLFECPSCKTKIEGEFDIPFLFLLSEDELNLLFLFLKTRGNLSEISKILGLSYPTTRQRFEEFLKKIGIEPFYSKDELMEILDLLEKGVITAEEAERKIREIK
ncbi:MAG: DUF2089 family protein [Candidatus Hydrothermales bacterium]